MNASEWRQVHLDMLDGVEELLCRSAPASARRQLAELRSGILQVGSNADRRLTERQLSQCLQDKPYFRSAWQGFVAKTFLEGLQATADLAEQLGTGKTFVRRARAAVATGLKKIRGKHSAKGRARRPPPGPRPASEGTGAVHPTIPAPGACEPSSRPCRPPRRQKA
jgi:hypothetical protein